MERAPSGLFVLAALFWLAIAGAAEAQPVRWRRDASDPHWVHGRVTVPVPPEAVWARLRAVDGWPGMFSDIRTMRVRTRERAHFVLHMETRTFECGSHDYHVRLDERRRTIVSAIDAPGTEAFARVTVAAGSVPGSATVAYSLHVRMTSILAWFISEDELRRKQRP